MTAPQPCAAGCPQHVAYYRNDKTGNPAPVDLVAVPDGNITLDFKKGTYHVLTKAELARVNGDLFGASLPPRFVLHFVTCAKAPSFRSCRRCHQRKCVCK